MKVLMISNSFGVNLEHYAHQIAEANSFSLDIYVLYIGGCSLQTHVKNITEDNPNYELFINGSSTHKMISIKEALAMNEWDYVSLQQASHLSGYLPSYYPFFEEVYNYVKNSCPNSKIMFHKTWAYSDAFPEKYIATKNNVKDFQFDNQKDMQEGIESAYKALSKDYKIDILIDSGSLIFKGKDFFDDLYDEEGFHMSNIGCYLIGCNLIYQLFNELPKTYYPNDIDKEKCDKLYKFLLG